MALRDEKLITLREAAKLVPTPDGKPIHIGTLNRWVLKGKAGVKLETAKFGRHRYTSREAILRFGEAVGDAPTMTELREMGPMPKRRRVSMTRSELAQRRECEAAKSRLRAAGLMD